MERLGWTLIHFLWQGTAIAAAAWLAGPAFRTARERYAVACLALAAMAAAPLATFAWLGSATPVKTTITPFDWGSSGVYLLGGPAPNALPGDGAWLFWVVAAWALGVTLCSVRMAGGWWVMQRLTRFRVPLGGEWSAAAGRLAERMGLSGEPRIFTSIRIDVPMVAGYLKPFIVLPAAALANLPAAQMETILAHEMAHILRRDPLVNLLQTAVEALLFYHPAVWWISTRMREERENCCDDVAVTVCGGPRLYAEALLALEQGRSTAPALALTSQGGSLARRVSRLLLPQTASRRSPLPAVLALVAVAMLGGITVRLLASPQPAMPASQTAAPYQRWVDEDVVLIISPEERAAYLRLGDAAEREHFIEQFWERRNPEPGAATNAYKQEHYRRIAWANQRCGGWKTVRGKLYVIAGPPDEIESHPEIYEAWRYRDLSGIGQVTWTFDLRQDKVTTVTLDGELGAPSTKQGQQERLRKLKQLQARIER